MSAIAGLWRLDGAADARQTTERMALGLAIYGPDRHGLWEAPDRQLALAWRQFAVTPEDGRDRQPRRAEDERYVLVADARIDNIGELAGELRLDSPTDAAVVLAAYRAWGPACLDRLVGDFAFTIWDERDRSLFLARDPLGIRPLYWGRGAGFFAFATMPRGLFAVPEITRGFDARNLAGHLALMPQIDDGTVYRDIRRIPPGHSLTVTEAGHELRPYWRPHAGTAPRSFEESAAALKQALTIAVECRLRTTGRVGSHISAGWDSSAVTAIAARLLSARRQRLISFTAVPRDGFTGPTLGGRLVDESQVAARVLQDFPNVDHVRVSSATQSHLTELDSQIAYQDLPATGPVNVVWVARIGAEARARGLRVMLTGGGGNATASYNGEGLLPDLVRRGRWIAWSVLLIRRARRGHSIRDGLAKSMRAVLPTVLLTAFRRVTGRMSHRLMDLTAIRAEFAEAADLEALATARGLNASTGMALDDRQNRMTALYRIDVGAFYASMNARFGIDLRNPMVDRRLIELCLAIPEEHFQHQGKEAAAFRAAMAGILPDWLLAHRNRGLQAADWFEGVVAARDELKEEIERLARSPMAARAIDLDRLRTLVAALPDPSTPHEELAKGRWGSPAVMQSYSSMMLRALSVGRFIRRTEGGNQ